MVAFAPIVAPFRTNVLEYSFCLFTSDRGVATLVKTIDGPQNTPSSRITPLYSATLFCILQPLPIITSGPAITFCPNEQFFPILVPDNI